MLLPRPLCSPHASERVRAANANTALGPRVGYRIVTNHLQDYSTQQQQCLPLLQLQSLVRCQIAAQAFDSKSINHSTGTFDNQPSSTSGREEQQQPQQEQQQQQQQDPLTFEEVQQLAAARGLYISLSTLGPGYRIVCRDGGADGPILGATAGFVAPLFGLMHCDTLQIFTRGMRGEPGDRIRKNPLGLGLLLGGAVFSYGKSCGCSKAEILAINDDDAWHERLVRYYSYFGFKPVCKVGGNGFFIDVPHLLVWGGEGTRMDADINETLDRWTPALRQSAARRSSSAAADPSSSRAATEAGSSEADGPTSSSSNSTKIGQQSTNTRV